MIWTDFLLPPCFQVKLDAVAFPMRSLFPLGTLDGALPLGAVLDPLGHRDSSGEQRGVARDLLRRLPDVWHHRLVALPAQEEGSPVVGSGTGYSP